MAVLRVQNQAAPNGRHTDDGDAGEPFADPLAGVALVGLRDGKQENGSHRHRTPSQTFKSSRNVMSLNWRPYVCFDNVIAHMRCSVYNYFPANVNSRF